MPEVLVRGVRRRGEVFLFVFTQEHAREAQRVAWSWIANPELSFGRDDLEAIREDLRAKARIDL